MPSSQAAAGERRTDRTMAHEPPKLKTTLKTPPKQATNPLQFVKVGPCSLYRTAQEQLQKVQEVKKIKQEVRDDPEDWQSNLDNWKSSRRKRQEHIIERVVEVKKLELEEHDRQRRRSKTFSEMMEERGNRGRKLSMSLSIYHEEDSNDLSDLGIGTSSGKSSVSGDTHDDTHSVLSDRDSEIDKNHSDLDNATCENGNNIIDNNNVTSGSHVLHPNLSIDKIKTTTFSNRFLNDLSQDQREYDSGTTATVSSPEPEEYTFEGAIRGYVTRVSQNLPRHTIVNLDMKLNKSKLNYFGEEKPTVNEKNDDVVKVDILKRREIFESASQKYAENNSVNNNNNSNKISKSIKERLSSLEKQNQEAVNQVDKNGKAFNRLSGDMSFIRDRLNYLEKQTAEKESKMSRKNLEELEPIQPLRERLSTLEKYVNDDFCSSSSSFSSRVSNSSRQTDDLSTIKNCLDDEKKSTDKELLNFDNQQTRNELTPSERSSSPDSDYRAPRAAFHRSLDSLDADGSSGPDIFDRVQSLEELNFPRTRYPASVSSAEILNDTDREDSGIHTADVSCSVSQADEHDEDIVQHQGTIGQAHEIIGEIQREVEKEQHHQELKISVQPSVEEFKTEMAVEKCQEKVDTQLQSAVIIEESMVIVSSPNEKAEPLDESSTPVESEEVTQASGPVTEVSTDDLLLDCAAVKSDQQDQRVPIKSSSINSTTHESIESNILSLSKPSVTLSNTMDFIGAPLTLPRSIIDFDLSNNEDMITDLMFPLRPSSSIEPPKEKPPPPPTDLSDEENQLIEPLKRLNSTRRIKKELRTRRSDFLGIEGIDDYDLELNLTKPPDMAAILAEERRIEQLHRRSFDTDSNYEQDSSHERDSGVELGHAEDWVKQPVSPDMSQHSRQSSEPFGASVTSSEEDEITKKEREIIEVLEKEEQWRYGNNREQNSDIGEKLAHKLRELEEEKMQLERERAQEEAQLQRQEEETLQKNDENVRKQEEDMLLRKQEAEKQQEIARATKEMKLREEEMRIDTERLRLHDQMINEERELGMDICRQEDIHLRSIDERVRQQEKSESSTALYNHDDMSGNNCTIQEVLRVERELLQLEQEELKRQINNMAYREAKQKQFTELNEQLQEQWQSLQDVNQESNISHATYQNINMVNYRSSMPNLQLQDNQRRRLAPPPIPPAKPLRLLDQRQRDVTIRNSRVPSADSIPQQLDASLRQSISTTTLAIQHPSQQMSKQTLQALSAVPRPRIVKSDQWVQRRKSEDPRMMRDFNYQHWLIQEAEQRRINEKNQRSSVRKPMQHVTGTSVPYSTVSLTKAEGKPLPDSIIQTLTQRMQNRAQERPPPIRRRMEPSMSQEHLPLLHHQPPQHHAMMHQKVHHSSSTSSNVDSQEKMLSVSGKKKCSHCSDELGRGAAMIIESLRLFYHMECFKCCVCHVRLGDGLMGTDVRVRNHKLHCHNCYSSDDGVKFSCV